MSHGVHKLECISLELLLPHPTWSHICRRSQNRKKQRLLITYYYKHKITHKQNHIYSCSLSTQNVRKYKVASKDIMVHKQSEIHDCCIIGSRKYGIADVHRNIFCKRVWNIFTSSISFQSYVYIFIFSSLLSTLYCVK